MQVTVKLAAVIVAGAILLVKIAVTARLLGTPVVGPGIVVAGAVENTRGRVTSRGVPTVVNFQAYGPVIAMPLARLVAPVIVTLYSVPIARAVPDVSVKVATVLVAFRVTTPVGFAHGATHVTVMLAIPEIGAIDSLNVAVMRVLVSTPVAPFAGVTLGYCGSTSGNSIRPEDAIPPAGRGQRAQRQRHQPRSAAGTALNDVHMHPLTL